MIGNTSKRTRIELKDYDFHQDVTNRLFLSHLSVFDIELLEELLNSSLTTNALLLASELGQPKDLVIASLKKLEQTQLFSLSGETVHVNKDQRQYYEAQLDRFQEELEPGLDAAKDLLRKVPIHVLPTWYSIPKTADSIFNALVEKNLQTPRDYEKYLEELEFEDELHRSLLQEVLESESLRIPASELCEKYQLSEEEFQECMLYLEFQFCLFSSYEPCGEGWREVISPFQWWGHYLRFQRKHQPRLLEKAQVREYHPQEFGFVQDMSHLLELVKQEGVSFEDEEAFTLDSETLQRLPSVGEGQTTRYWQQVVFRLCAAHLAKIVRGELVFTENTENWLYFSIPDRAMYLYRHPNIAQRDKELPETLWNIKELRKIEKCLASLKVGDWYGFEDFLAGLTVAIGSCEPVVLKRIKRQWIYQLPQYRSEEIQGIHDAIFHRLFEVGMVKKGSCEGKECFALTSFGGEALSY